jgi:hypothetical protein
MRPLNVNSHGTADVRDIRVGLRPILGGFEFYVMLEVAPFEVKTKARWLEVESARLLAGASPNTAGPLGCARPDRNFRFAQDGSVFSQRLELIVPLETSHVAKIEEARGDCDLWLRIRLLGTGGQVDGEVPVSTFDETLDYVVPRSEWIAQLNSSGAANVLLFETVLPIGIGEAETNGVASLIRKAQTHFIHGLYADCVGACRPVLERLGVTSQPIWTLYKADPKVDPKPDAMLQAARVRLLAAALQHTTHDPHHARPESDPHEFTRAEARLILQMTAAYAAYLAAAD